MSIFDRKPALRWLTPLAFVLVVGGTGGIVAATATAGPRLPSRSAAALLVDLQQVKVDAMSGTVVQNSDLGFPALPGMGGSNSASLTSLISGTHTLHVWYSGPDKARLRVQGAFDETDVITNGSDMWTWSYKAKAATHRVLSATQANQKQTARVPAEVPKTPQEAAAQVLKAIDPTTTVSTAGTAKVAGRAAYELVLQPKVGDSLVKQVRIAIDGTKHIPLRVEVIARNNRTAFEVAYTAVDFNRPDDSEFVFKAPRGTVVTQVAPNGDQGAGKGKGDKQSQAKKGAGVPKPNQADQPKFVGKGWSTVVVAKMPGSGTATATGQLGRVLNALPVVSGRWGKGRLLSGTAFSAVLTNDGRIAMGSVQPQLLYNALSK